MTDTTDTDRIPRWTRRPKGSRSLASDWPHEPDCAERSWRPCRPGRRARLEPAPDATGPP